MLPIEFGSPPARAAACIEDEEICVAPIEHIRITRVVPLGGYRLRLSFSNGTSGEIDIATLIGFTGALAPLANPAVFHRATIDERGALCWPGDIDLDSNVLYYATMRLPNPLAMSTPA